MNKAFLKVLVLLFCTIYTSVSQTDLIKEIIQSVSIDSIREKIIDLQNFQTRYEYSPQQESAGVYIFNRLLAAGLNPEFEEYGIGQVSFFSIENVGESTIWIAGSKGALISSANAGETWSYLNTGTENTIFDIDFYNRFTGWIVGNNGLIKKSNDQGNTWLQQNSNTAVALYSIGFYDLDTGIIVGGTGKILRTTNGGNNWISIASQTNQNLNDLFLLNQNNTWAVGNAGTILFSSNMGLTWIKQSPPLEGFGDYRSVHFIDSLTGWISAIGEFILKTTNGGMDWEKINLPKIYGMNFNKIKFIDPLNGWLIAQSGYILKTTNGGLEWSLQHSHTGWTISFYDILPVTNNRLIVCGRNGHLYVSNDGGETWNYKTSALPERYVHISNNIVAKINGKIKPENEYILVAHYDSWSNQRESLAPGADDNASGTAAVMEAARILKNYELESTINFLLVSGEELGMFGSDYHAFNAKTLKRNIQGVINTDMIGYPIGYIQPRLIVGSFQKYNHLIDSIIEYNSRHNLNIFLDPVIDHTGASDYGPFALAGYNSIHISEGTPEEIWGGANPYYHTIFDTYDKLNPNLLIKATQLIVASAAELVKPIGRVSVNESEITSNFYLYQNFPNPFNSSTNIKFNVPEESFVSIKVFDLLGREINTLVDEHKLPGIYNITLNTERYTNLTSGVYFYRLVARTSTNNLYTITKKLLFLR